MPTHTDHLYPYRLAHPVLAMSSSTCYASESQFRATSTLASYRSRGISRQWCNHIVLVPRSYMRDDITFCWKGCRPSTSSTRGSNAPLHISVPIEINSWSDLFTAYGCHTSWTRFVNIFFSQKIGSASQLPLSNSWCTDRNGNDWLLARKNYGHKDWLMTI